MTQTAKQVLNSQRARLLRDLAGCVAQLNRIQGAVERLDIEPEFTSSPSNRLYNFHDFRNRLKSLDDSLRGQWGWKPRETFDSLIAKQYKQNMENNP